MNLDLTVEDLAFRDEVRAFLDFSLTPQLRQAGRRSTSVFVDKSYSLLWQKSLHAKGWAAPGWPAEYGGPGWNDMQHHLFAALASGKPAGPASSMLKTVGTEMMQRLDEIALGVAAVYGAVDQPLARAPGSHRDFIGPEYALVTAARYLNNRAGSIYGGSNEVQRNIMARLVLGV